MNMKTATMNILSLILIVMTYMCILTGCKAESTDVTGNGKYLKTISKERLGSIVYDTRTGVEYWQSYGEHNKGNLTVMFDKDGKPLIYDGSDEE